MKMHHEERISIALSSDDPWQTERRSSDYIIGDMPADGAEIAHLAGLSWTSCPFRPSGVPGDLLR